MNAKIRHSIELLRNSEELALKYNDFGFHLAFSGGKDSQVVYELAKMAGVKFKAFFLLILLNNLITERQFLPPAAELTNGFPCREFYEKRMETDRTPCRD